METKRKLKFVVLAALASLALITFFISTYGVLWAYMNYVFAFVADKFGRGIASSLTAAIMFFFTFTAVFYMAFTDEERSGRYEG